MSFSSLVSDLTYRDRNGDDKRSQISRARSYASTAATSVSISGDISSQLHGGYSHPLARAWQAERQLTKVRKPSLIARFLLRQSHCAYNWPTTTPLCIQLGAAGEGKLTAWSRFEACR